MLTSCYLIITLRQNQLLGLISISVMLFLKYNLAHKTNVHLLIHIRNTYSTALYMGFMKWSVC